MYRAIQVSVDREVAVKVENRTLESDKDQRRFVREARAAGRMSSHPHVVDLFDVGVTDDGHPFMIMELCEGTYADRMKTDPLSAQEAREVGQKIADALADAHMLGVLHRDVKPANCFFANDGSVKVGDFGLSISTLVKAEQQLTQPGAVLGTPAFASPEQLRAQEIDVRSDIYSVGATLYFLLTGKPTHDAETLVALIAAVLERDPIEPQVLRPDLPYSLSRVIIPPPKGYSATNPLNGRL